MVGVLSKLMSMTHITKQAGIELSVPNEWRKALKNLADFFTFQEILLQRTSISVAPMRPSGNISVKKRHYLEQITNKLVFLHLDVRGGQF